jgi:type II secretory pathway pseudopilin PulG
MMKRFVRNNMLYRRSNTQRGDTIVEVLIAMAVLGLVLASAFAISNRSYATGLNAQERNEALKIAESQVELLRIASTLTDESIIDADSADPDRLFCIEPSGAELERVKFDSDAVVEDQGDLDETQYPTIGATNGDCNFGTSDRYYVSIQQFADVDSSDVPTGGQIFSVRVYWESIFGGASNVVNHEFRTYNFENSFSLSAPTNFNGSLGGGGGGGGGGGNVAGVSLTIDKASVGPTSIGKVSFNLSDQSYKTCGILITDSINPPTLSFYKNKYDVDCKTNGELSSDVISGLLPGVTYNIVAFAQKNNGEVSYSGAQIITTKNPIVAEIIVKKIPSCGSTSETDMSGITISVKSTPGSSYSSEIVTNSESKAIFNDLSSNSTYNVTASSAPTGHVLCPPTTTTIATGEPGQTVKNTTFKIRPIICVNFVTGYTIINTYGLIITIVSPSYTIITFGPITTSTPIYGYTCS